MAATQTPSSLTPPPSATRTLTSLLLTRQSLLTESQFLSSYLPASPPSPSSLTPINSPTTQPTKPKQNPNPEVYNFYAFPCTSSSALLSQPKPYTHVQQLPSSRIEKYVRAQMQEVRMRLAVVEVEIELVFLRERGRVRDL
ncbi:MAG: hypothetical protein LQ338_005518 [Usnochroma carphineum]|nr:MAG: hypothetical protein LQ338_005518 [Usnochroma carphineum]